LIIAIPATDDKLSLKGAWSRHVNQFRFLSPNIPGTAQAINFKFPTLVGHVKY